MSRTNDFRHPQGGFTLIEVMIALGIAVLMVSVAIPAVSVISTVKRQSATSELSGTIRYLFDKAQLDHKYIRLTFDLDDGSYRAEEADNPVALSSEKLELSDGAVEEPEPDEDEALSAEEEEERIFGSNMTNLFEDQFEWQGWYNFKEKMRRKIVNYSEFTDEIIKPKKLPETVSIDGVVTTTLDGKATKGKVSIFIFPNGWIQPAVIYIKDNDDEQVWSIRIEPLSGRAIVVEGEIKPPDFERDAQDEEERL